MTGIALLGAAVAAMLLYSGWKGYDPRSLFTSVFTGSAPTPLAGSASALSSGGTSGAATNTGTCVDAKGLGTYSNGSPGGVRLLPEALASFKRAEEIAHQRIILTGSYRTCAVQIAGHTADPNRFADPAESYHPKGLAVDVNMTTSYNQRVAAALVSAGWCQPRAADEPWHFSYGGCG